MRLGAVAVLLMMSWNGLGAWAEVSVTVRPGGLVDFVGSQEAVQQVEGMLHFSYKVFDEFRRHFSGPAAEFVPSALRHYDQTFPIAYPSIHI